MAGVNFPGLRPEVSRILGKDFVNLQVLHEALDQPGGLVELATYLSEQTGEEQFMLAHELRQRFLHRRIVRPRLEDTSWSATELQEQYKEILKKEALPVRTVRKSRLSQSLVLEVGNPAQAAEEERIRWANALAEYIVEAKLPVVKVMERAEVQTKIWGRIFGSRRAKTLRNRYGLQQDFPMVQVVMDDDYEEEWKDGLLRAVPMEDEPASSSTQGRKEMKFWVSISRRTGFRRLHKMHGCGVMHWTVAAYEEVEEPGRVKADAWCKICFRQELAQRGEDEDDSSSSDEDSKEAEPED
eukprot:s3783_g5.t1